MILEPKHANSRTSKRPTEGSRANSGAARNAKTAEVRRGRGRPPGVKNKSKSLVPTELANEMLLKLESTIPPEQFKYLKGVIKEGKAVSTKQELDMLILLLNRNLWPALVMESSATDASDLTIDDEEVEEKIDKSVGPVFRKDVTERLKVLKSLLELRHQIDKHEDTDGDGSEPLVQIFAARKLSGRLGVLVGQVPDQKMLPEPERVAHDDRDIATVE